MSDYSFHIEPAICLQAHSEIDTAARRIRTLLAEVDQDGQRLMSIWEGDAQDAFRARQRQWHADAEVILSKLGQINDGLARAVQIYVDADKRGANLITGS